MYGKTNAGGSGSGSFAMSDDAVLAVTSGVNATVTLEKSGITKTASSFIKADDATKKIHLFSIKQSQFDSSNPWVITATESSATTTKNITISDSRFYEDNVLSRLPYGYTEYTYIQSSSSGNNYINTGVAANGIARMQIDGRIVSSIDYRPLFGASGSKADAETSAFVYMPKNGYFSLGTGNHTNSAGTITSTSSDFSFFIEMKSSQYVMIKINDTTTYNQTLSGAIPTIVDKPLWLFATNYNGSYYPTGTSSGCVSLVARIYSCKIWNRSGTLVRDFVPCKDETNDKFGLFNLVNSTFYAVSGSFTGGSVVS